MRSLAILLLLSLPAAATITVTASHPNRLMLDTQRISDVTAKVGTAEWTAFVAQANAGTSNPSSNWTEYVAHGAVSAAIICRITGDQSYCASALTALNSNYAYVKSTSNNPGTFDPTNDWMINGLNLWMDDAPKLAGASYAIQYWGSSCVLPSPLVKDTTYWISYAGKNSTTRQSFWYVSATRDGAPIDIEGTSTGSCWVDATWRRIGGTTGSNAPRWYMHYWAYTYDLLSEYMGEADRTKWYNFFRSGLMHVARLDYASGGRILNNVWVGSHRGGILFGIAIIGDDPTDTAAIQTNLNTLDSDFATEIANKGQYLTAGFTEGTEYTPGPLMNLLEMWDAIRVATQGADNRTAGSMRGYVEEALDYYLYAILPAQFTYNGTSYADLVQHGEIGQAYLMLARSGGAKHVAPMGAMRASMLMLHEVFRFLPDATRKSYARYILDNFMPPALLHATPTDWTSTRMVYDVIFNHVSGAGALWPAEPRIRRFPKTNDTFMRSSWATDATYVNTFGSLAYAAGSGIDHIKSEAGAFTIYRKGVPLTGNWTNYPYDSSNNIPYDYQSHSGIGIWPSAFNVVAPAGVTAWNSNVSGSPQGGITVPRFESGSSYAYGRYDMTPAFRHYAGQYPYYAWGNTNFILSRVQRDWMWLGPDIFAVYDVVEKQTGTPGSLWNLQGLGHTLTNDATSMTVTAAAGQKLTAQMVLPSAPAIMQRRSDRAYVSWCSRSATPVLTFEYKVRATTNITLSGATGQWAVLNGTWNITAKDVRTFQINAGQVSTAAITESFAGQSITLDHDGTRSITALFDAAYSLNGGKYFTIGGAESTQDRFFVLMEASDTFATSTAVNRMPSTNADIAQIGTTYVVGFVGDATPILPITYQHSATGPHRIAGLTPSTSYTVDTSTASVVVIGGQSGANITTSAAGVLAFSATGLPPTPVGIVTLTLPGGTVGSSYSSQLTAGGGLPQYTWTVTAGTLPNGLQLSSGGLIYGTPTTAGTAEFTVRAADSQSPASTDSKSLSLSIEDVALPTDPSPAIVVETITGATVRIRYGYAELRATTVCSITSSLGTVSDGGGPARRRWTLALPESSDEAISVTCGTGTDSTTVATREAATGTAAITIMVSAAGTYTHAALDTSADGATWDTGSAVSCASGCILSSSDFNRGTVYWIRIRRLTGGTAMVTGSSQQVVVQ